MAKSNRKNISQFSRRNLDLYSNGYKNLIVMGDFNTESHQSDMKDFCGPCQKNPENSLCIDLILTNCPQSFQNSCVMETGDI